ncbi:MAG: nuclear transport factor 2 family protein [Pyrinomonadaceae bacterium]
MKRHTLRLGVSLVTFLFSLAVSTVPSFLHLNTAPNNRYEREVLTANEAYINAHLSRDVAALNDLLADEFTVNGYGRGTDKARRLALVANPNVAFVSMNSSDVHVMASENTGAVSGRGVLVMRFGGEEYDSRPYLFIRSFERRDGRWQIVSVQVTPAE